MAESALWRAVIEQAERDLLYPELEFKGQPATFAQEMRVRALDWVQSTDQGVGAYEWACAQLEIDPAKLRRKVQQMTVEGMMV